MGETGFFKIVNNEYTDTDIKPTTITRTVQLFIVKHHNKWRGTAASLLKQIDKFKPLNDLQWPRSSMEMAKWLQIATHELLNNGIVVHFYKRHGVRLIYITA
jgi:hypothetical protein